MPDRDGVEIYKRFYPWPDAFRLGDPVLVKEITGMRWPDFAAALQDQNEAIDEAVEMGLPSPEPDQVVLAGLIAVAFWQGNPHMSREKARRALERIPMEDIEVIDGDEGEVELGPPALGGVEDAALPPRMTSNGSEHSPEESLETSRQDSSLDVTSPNGSGLPGSPITSPESLPA
jgi:hypothetical protein